MKKKTQITALGALLTLLLAVFVCWASTDPQALESVKELTVTITHSDEFLEISGTDEPFELTFETTAKTLAQALTERSEFTLTQGDRGMELSVADYELADTWHNFHWICYWDGELLEPPLEEHPIADGEKYYFYLTEEN